MWFVTCAKRGQDEGDIIYTPRERHFVLFIIVLMITNNVLEDIYATLGRKEKVIENWKEKQKESIIGEECGFGFFSLLGFLLCNSNPSTLLHVRLSHSSTF